MIGLLLIDEVLYHLYDDFGILDQPMLVIVERRAILDKSNDFDIYDTLDFDYRAVYVGLGALGISVF